MPRVIAALATLALAAVGGGGLAGCGPITYVGDVTRRASDAVDEARAAEAERYAPYWWTRATLYLHKAREVAAHADFQGADRYGKLATDAALKAAADARIAAKEPAGKPGADAASGKPAAEAAPAKPTEAPIAPSRDLPKPPAKDLPVPAKEQPVPAKEPAPRPKVAPAKEPP